LIDCRVAVEDGDVIGIILTAPASYWWQAPLRHPLMAIECAYARFVRQRRRRRRSNGVKQAGATPPPPPCQFQEGPPPRTWAEPAGAWRIMFMGIAPTARRRGVGGRLSSAVAADRPIVAHISCDNVASIRLHASLGWSFYRNGDVALVTNAAPVQSTAAAAGRR
jgi:ribosomal protein S18 acetylase RimI-like enzyme